MGSSQIVSLTIAFLCATLTCCSNPALQDDLSRVQAASALARLENSPSFGSSQHLLHKRSPSGTAGDAQPADHPRPGHGRPTRSAYRDAGTGVDTEPRVDGVHQHPTRIHRPRRASDDYRIKAEINMLRGSHLLSSQCLSELTLAQPRSKSPPLSGTDRDRA